MNTLYTFDVSWSLDTYGWGTATVIAPNPVAALVLAGDTDAGWMLQDSHVRVHTIERRFLAVCSHYAGSGTDRGTFECDDCRETWPQDGDSPEPTATTHGFRAYCEALAVAGRF